LKLALPATISTAEVDTLYEPKLLHEVLLRQVAVIGLLILGAFSTNYPMVALKQNRKVLTSYFIRYFNY